MSYLDRTKLVRDAVLAKPDMLRRIQYVFREHFAGRTKGLRATLWFREGGQRVVYHVGTCEIGASGSKLQVLLKLYHDPKDENTLWDHVAGLIPGSENYTTELVTELAALGLYYETAARLRENISFVSDEAYEHYLAEVRSNPFSAKALSKEFSLNSPDWPGASVQPGDVGALPFAHVAVSCCDEAGVHRSGCLMEGIPPIIKPNGTAYDGDDHGVVEGGRILDPTNGLLCTLNGRPIKGSHPDRLGFLRRGREYLLPENRIDIV